MYHDHLHNYCHFTMIRPKAIPMQMQS